MDQHRKNDSKKLTGRHYDRSYYCEHTEISSGNNFGAKTLIEYDDDETLVIEEEVIQDQDTITGQKRDKKYDLKLCTVDIRSDDSSIGNKKLCTPKKNTIPELELEPEKRHKCEKCARTYKYKYRLTRHQKFECGVSPQFRCKFCDKRFKQKAHMTSHVQRLHGEKNSKKSQVRHICDKCFRSYRSINGLNRHKRLDHAAIKPQFTCDYCSHKVKEKGNLSKHIISQHLQ